MASPSETTTTESVYFVCSGTSQTYTKSRLMQCVYRLLNVAIYIHFLVSDTAGHVPGNEGLFIWLQVNRLFPL